MNLKAMIRRVVFFLGYSISYKTPNNDILALIKTLRPYDTGINLIRLGAPNDSGYLVPDDLKGIKACFSPGSDKKFQFENDCFDLGMDIFIADKTVEEHEVPTKFNFIKKHIEPGGHDNNIQMDKWVNDNIKKDKLDLLLQMDIEGSEYLNIIDLSNKTLKKFRIIIIEFHHLDHLANPLFFDTSVRVFSKLLESHTCVHIHPNNSSKLVKINRLEIPPLLEITFLRNDRIKEKSVIKSFPHKLDADCCVDKRHVKLPKIWYTD